MRNTPRLRSLLGVNIDMPEAASAKIVGLVTAMPICKFVSPTPLETLSPRKVLAVLEAGLPPLLGGLAALWLIDRTVCLGYRTASSHFDNGFDVRC